MSSALPIIHHRDFPSTGKHSRNVSNFPFSLSTFKSLLATLSPVFFFINLFHWWLFPDIPPILALKHSLHKSSMSVDFPASFFPPTSYFPSPSPVDLPAMHQSLLPSIFPTLIYRFNMPLSSFFFSFTGTPSFHLILTSFQRSFLFSRYFVEFHLLRRNVILNMCHSGLASIVSLKGVVHS